MFLRLELKEIKKKEMRRKYNNVKRIELNSLSKSEAWNNVIRVMQL